MKVHIVNRDLHTDRILPRLALAVADGIGWSISGDVDPAADWNYFVPYLDVVPVEGRSAAYFSHYDKNRKAKAEAWQRAAELVDLRIVTSRQYQQMLEPYGATVLIPPPVDHTVFNIREKAAHTRKRVGFAGWVYNDGRKGEHLVARLSTSDLSSSVDFVASGQGWPVPTKLYALNDLPGYFNSLDLFVCASLFEGVPMPPLEALSCGIPVVIPRGVGLLDDLPDIPGIYRFDAGDYDSLYESIRIALNSGDVPRQALRDAVMPYNADTWSLGHHDAISAIDSPPLADAPLPAWQGRAGLYMVAYGRPARECAKTAMESFRSHMPGVPIALASAEPMGIEDYALNLPDSDIGGRVAKLSVDTAAPPEWDYVLYLDADTETIAPVCYLFDALQAGWELVICKNPDKYYTTRRMVRADNKPECEATYRIMGTDDALQLNGGVWAYRRNERTRLFFQYWLEEWHVYGGRDQAALLRALWRMPLRMLVLGNEWNTVTRYADASQSAGILHHPMTARRWSGKIDGRIDSAKAWAQVKPEDK